MGTKKINELSLHLMFCDNTVTKEFNELAVLEQQGKLTKCQPQTKKVCISKKLALIRKTMKSLKLAENKNRTAPKIEKEDLSHKIFLLRVRRKELLIELHDCHNVTCPNK